MKYSIPNLHPIAAQKLVSTLFKGERFVLFDFLVSRWFNSFAVMLEEQLIRLLNALANILHRLRSDLLPEFVALPKFGNMSLKLGTTQVLAPHAVVPFMEIMESNAVVVDDSSSINRPLEMAVAFVLIELKLQCPHDFYDPLPCR